VELGKSACALNAAWIDVASGPGNCNEDAGEGARATQS
jgi:hypothetical protein